MIALLIVASVAVSLLLVGLVRRERSRRSIDRHAHALETLGRMAREGSAEPRVPSGPDTPLDTLQAKSAHDRVSSLPPAELRWPSTWAAPPPPPPGAPRAGELEPSRRGEDRDASHVTRLQRFQAMGKPRAPQVGSRIVGTTWEAVQPWLVMLGEGAARLSALLVASAIAVTRRVTVRSMHPISRFDARLPSGVTRWLGAVAGFALAAGVVAIVAIGSGSHGAISSATAGRTAPQRTSEPTGHHLSHVALPTHVRPSAKATKAEGPRSTTGRGAPAPSPPSPARPSAAPVVAAIAPASGSPGQSVTLVGAGFMSAGGRITVMFGSAQAQVTCPDQTACIATVPDGASAKPAAAILVTVTTDSGTSEPVRFSYQRGTPH